jgi:hypothetical protein
MGVLSPSAAQIWSGVISPSSAFLLLFMVEVHISYRLIMEIKEGV